MGDMAIVTAVIVFKNRKSDMYVVQWSAMPIDDDCPMCA